MVGQRACREDTAIPSEAWVPGAVPGYTWARGIVSTTWGGAELHLVLQRLSL